MARGWWRFAMGVEEEGEEERFPEFEPEAMGCCWVIGDALGGKGRGEEERRERRNRTRWY